MSRDDHDLDFDQLMAEEGAKRMGRGGPRPAARPSLPAHGASPAAAVPRGPDPRVATLEQDLRDARASALERDARLVELSARLVAVESERDGALARVAPLEHEIRTAKLRLDAAEHARASAEDRLTRQASPPGVAPNAPSAVAPEAAPQLSLAEALSARGVTAEEQLAAVAALGGKPEARSLLDHLVARDPDDLEGFLERRLALVCGAPACVPQDAAAVLVVEPARCDVCGGSDIQRAAGAFATACAAAGLARVRVIGGSPAYRTQLEHLFPKGGPLTVLTMRGDKRVSLNRSKRHQSNDDLVIVWGATELDHATSGAYRAAYGRVMTVAHRGIGRMLELAAGRITAEIGGPR